MGECALMNKKLKKIIIPVLVIILMYGLSCLIVRIYIFSSTPNSIRFLGNAYSQYDGTVDGNFIPYGSVLAGSSKEIKFNNIFGLSFAKKDKERNFVYLRGLFYNPVVYKKDSYVIFETPSVEDIVEIDVYDSNSQLKKSLLIRRKFRE